MDLRSPKDCFLRAPNREPAAAAATSSAQMEVWVFETKGRFFGLIFEGRELWPPPQPESPAAGAAGE